MSGESSGRTILSFVLVIITAVRLMYTCSNMNRSNTSNPVDTEFMEQIRNSQEAAIQNAVDLKNARKTISNNILYTPYKGLDSLQPQEIENYGLEKLKKDSLAVLGFTTKMRVPKNYYFQNNHDDTLRLAFKSPDNLNVFIHDFDSKEDIEKNFKNLKNQSNLQKYKVENTIEEVKAVSYKISKDKMRFNGYALFFQVKKSEHQTFFEFESAILSKEDLKRKALDFLAHNMIEKK